MNEEEELDPIEKELKEAQEQFEAENQEIYDEVTKGNEEIRRKNTEDDDDQLNLPLESRNLARVGAGLAFEVGANSLLDALTFVPVAGQASQAVGSAVINTIAQGIRGGKFSFGEVLGSAVASQIPGLAQGKAITKAGRITRAAGTGAVSGAIESTSIAAVDEGRLPTAQEFGLGVGAGGIFGAGFAQAADLVDPKVTGIFRDLRARIQQGRQSSFELAGTVAAARPRKARPGPGQGEFDFSYAELNKTIKKPLTEADLTPEERVRYAQENADEIDLSSFLEQQGAQTVTRKPLRINYVKPFQTKYGATDEQVKRYVKITNRKIVDVKKTISYLNDVYKMGLPTADLEDVAADMSLLFRQDINPQTLDAIVNGQGGKILFQTDGMKSRGQKPFEITDRESLLQVYRSRLELLNKHGAFDKGHVYAADQLLKDNNVSSVDMYNNLEPEIRASIQQLVEPIELEQLINGQLTKNVDYIEAIIGNRSKKAGGDPADKVFERLYGKAYGLEEDFRNFLFPDQDIANMIHKDLKPFFGRLYVRKVKQIVKEREGIGPVKNKVGSQSLNFIREQAMKEVLEDFVADGTLIKSDAAYQESLANIQNMFDFLLGRRMVNPKTNEIDRGNIADGGYELTLDQVLGEL